MPDEGFIFTGSAVAFGARLDVPDLRDVRGSITLPSLGGTAALQLGLTEDKDNDDLLYRFRSASSSVTGEGYDYPRNRGKREYETRVACSVERLELWDVVRTDLISATLVSTFVEHHRFHEETVTLRGLSVNGEDRAVERRMPRALNNECTTLKEMIESARACGQLTDNLSAVRTLKDGSPSPDSGKLVLKSDRIVCYLFEPNYITFMRGRIKYELFLGEYVIDQDLRRLTMLRMEAHDPSNDKGRGGRGEHRKKSGTRNGGDGGEDKEGSVTVVQPLVNGHRPP